MYRTIIELKKGLPEDILEELRHIAEKAFNNRAGVLKNVSEEPHLLIYEGDFNDYGCLELGMYSLEENKKFFSKVVKWDWIDEDPNENENMLEVFAMPIQ